MSDGFTPAQLAQLQGIIREMVAPSQPTATPASIAPSAPLSFDAEPAKQTRREVSAEQLAADAVDPLRNAYTPLARKYDFALYEPIWRKERQRLLDAGVPKSAAGKQAQANYGALLKIEKARLAARDKATGLLSERIPVVDGEKIRGIGSHGDPTANQAIYNVDRIAQLRAELAALESPGLPVDLVPRERKAASNRSIAQKAKGANPYQRTIDKLVEAAKASGKPKSFVEQWFSTSVQDSPLRRAILAGQATKACQALGIPVKG